MKTISRAIVIAALFWLLPDFVYAQDGGTVVGSVVDAETGAPIGFTQVLLEEVSRSATADADGRFEIRFVHPDAYTLRAYRIGYEPLTRTVRVPPGDTLFVTLRMTISPIEQGEILVEGARAEARQFVDAAMEMEGRRLRQKLGTTIAETLDREPGIAMRSMGPAPARPVLRGLGGERLLVLEDGARTGDLSATSTDHAVVIDPLTSERIEIIRGPAALIYGSNTLGGVVNVVRGRIPTVRPPRMQFGAGIQGQSVNNGLSGGVALMAPVGPIAVRVDGSLRTAGDMATPAGILDNTDLTTLNGSVGATWLGPWGHAGLAGGYYSSSYGIPGGFVGAHPHGVSIELNRSRLDGRAELFDPLPAIPRLELEGSVSRYVHREYETDDILGIEYGLISYHGRALFHMHQNGHRRKGAFGIWSEYRDYAAGGYSHTPASIEWTLAGFGFQDIHFDALTLQTGLRYDYRQVRPTDIHDADHTAEHPDDEEEHEVGRRRFGGISAALTGMIHPRERISIGASLQRSMRMPGIEELFSEGPHLAAYSFEIGNSDLEEEFGFGMEIFARIDGRRASVSFAVFRNAIQNYIYPRNTGAVHVRTLLPIYQLTGARALLTGAEASGQVRIHQQIELGGSVSYVQGTLTDSDEPLPWMPPLRSQVDLTYSLRRLTIGGSVIGAAAQKRTGLFEEPTDGYVVFGAHAQYYFTAGSMLHTIDLVAENLMNATYRDHLSRVKTVMPEPGRNIKLLYKLYF